MDVKMSIKKLERCDIEKSNLKKLIMPLGILIIVLSIVFLSDGLLILGVMAGVLIVFLPGEEELKK